MWLKPEEPGQPIASHLTENLEMASALWTSRSASLYFSSSESFKEKYCTALTQELGLNFGAFLPDYTVATEIEIFASIAGNYTPFHIDF